MTHTLEEARREVHQAETWRRTPPEWAARMVREAEGRPTVADLEAAFLEVGLSESDARSAASGLAEGRYVSFEDAVASRVMWDRTRRRNRVVPSKVAEVAGRLQARRSAVEETDTKAQLLQEVAELAVSRMGYTEERAAVYAEEATRSPGNVLESLRVRRDALKSQPTHAERTARLTGRPVQS